MKYILNIILFDISFADVKSITKFIMPFSSYLSFIFFRSNVNVSLLSNPTKFISCEELITFLFLFISCPMDKS